MLSSGLDAVGNLKEPRSTPQALGAVPSARDAMAGLKAIITALDGLRAPDRLPLAARLALIAQLETDTRVAVAAAIADAARLQVHGVALWRSFAEQACHLFGILLELYGDLSDRAGLSEEMRSEIDLRLAGAAAQRLRWELQSCVPEHRQLWRRIGDIWLRANGSGPAARECLRALAYYSAGFDQVPPAAVPAVDSLIGVAIPFLALAPGATAVGRYLFDPAAGKPPRRLVRVEQPENGALTFVAADACAILSGFSSQVADGVVPPGLAGAADVAQLAEALQILLRLWSEAPPVRRYRRHQLGGALKVVRGFDRIRALLAGNLQDDNSLWQLQNASRCGLAALVPPAERERICLGDLVGLQASESHEEVWHLGIVRRMRATENGLLVGVETISQRPIFVSADDGRVAHDALLCDPLLKGEAARILAEPGKLPAAGALFISHHGTVHKLKPLDASASGYDFELRVYQVM